MRKIFRLYLIVSAFLLISGSGYAQCDAMRHKDKCVQRLADGFTFIKSYLIDGARANTNGEIEYSFVFSKGTLYMLTIADNTGAAENIEIKLYDPQHKLLASNFDKKSGKFFPIGYPCSTTGVHYMTFKYHGNGNACGLSVLGFKR